MPGQNIEIVRAMLEPFNGIDATAIDMDAEAIRELIQSANSPNVELRPLESGAGSGPSALYRGWDGLVEYLREWLEPFSEYHVELLDYIEAGDCVLVPSRQWGVGSASGARVEIELTFVYELRDGKIVRIDQYDTVEDAREAAGLRE
jgi:ketosteroid isomerase-like protein